MKTLRVNMEKETVSYEDLPDEWRLIGGSGLIAKIMEKEVPPDADPLGPQNKLIIAAGPLAGTMAPQLGRISVGAKARKQLRRQSLSQRWNWLSRSQAAK